MNAILSNIDVLDKKSKCLPDTHRRFVQKTDQETIPLIRTSVKECLYLVLRNGLRSLPVFCRLLQDIFLNRRTFSDMVKERFVPPGTSWQIRRRCFLQVGRDFFHSPMEILEPSNPSKTMVHLAVRPTFWDWFIRNHLYPPCRHFNANT